MAMGALPFNPTMLESSIGLLNVSQHLTKAPKAPKGQDSASMGGLLFNMNHNHPRRRLDAHNNHPRSSMDGLSACLSAF